MRLIYLLITFIFATSTYAAGRQQTPLADGWKFARPDITGAQRPDYDDSKWSTISVPHTWNTADEKPAVAVPAGIAAPLSSPRLQESATSCVSRPPPRSPMCSSTGKTWASTGAVLPHSVSKSAIH